MGAARGVKMIEEIACFTTKDGKIHRTVEQAEKHIVAQLENMIGPIVDRAVLSVKERLRVVDMLIGTPTQAHNLKMILDKFV